MSSLEEGLMTILTSSPWQPWRFAWLLSHMAPRRETVGAVSLVLTKLVARGDIQAVLQPQDFCTYFATTPEGVIACYVYLDTVETDARKSLLWNEVLLQWAFCARWPNTREEKELFKHAREVLKWN